MGFDLSGLNPKMNMKPEELPVYNKYNSMDFREKWKALDKDKKMSEQYFEELGTYEEANPGVYFRNNCWWWRPLWNYCYHVGDIVISHEVYESGHSNSGAGLNDEDAKLLGALLLTEIASGRTEEYKEEYQKRLDRLEPSDFDRHYPFDVENVRDFAMFCLESGGFEIC